MFLYNSVGRTLLASAFCGVLPLVSVSAQSPVAENAREHAPVSLSRSIPGREVLRTLRQRLPDVARVNRMPEQRVEKLLLREHHLWVDRELQLYYVCEGLAADAAQPEAHSAAEAPTAIPSGPDVFKLHSLPGAQRIIYLDFNGHVTTNTAWNRNKTGGADIVSAPFDTDGNPSAWSLAEQDRIRRIWQRVAEDYMPFAVDVTTEDPGVEALRRVNTADNQFGIRMVISPSSAWYGSAGGVAYVGSFMWTSDTPAFVFADKLGPNNEKFVAEAVSHEAGHALGLSHDGKTDGTAYYSGHGNWAPIMGVGYSKTVTQWSKGEYAGANNTEDDLAVIPANGAPLLVDDHGNDLSTTSVLSGPTVATLGVIERRSDVDVFRFNTGAGQVTFTARSTGPESNLDAKIEVLNSAGVILASSDPTGMSASVALNVAAGTYFVRIEGVAYGDPATTGYSDYGSLGEYQLTGGIIDSAPAAPLWSSIDGGFEAVSTGEPGYSSFRYAPAYPGCTFTGNAGISGNASGFTSGNAPAPQGTHVAFVQSRGSLSFPVTFDAGSFRVRAQIANRVNWGGVQTVVVALDGVQIGTFAAGAGYVSAATNPFNVGQGLHTLSFTGQNAADATLFMDALVIEPAAAALPVSVATAGFETPQVGSNSFGAFLYRPGHVTGSQEWTFAGHAGVSGNGSGFTQQNANAPEGTQVGFLQMNDSSMRQTLPFSSTGNYTLTVSAAKRGIWNVGQQIVEVLVDGKAVGTFSPAGTQYQTFSVPFSTSQGNHEVMLRGTVATDATALIDQVRIERVN